MTNAQNATYHAVKELLSADRSSLGPPVPLYEGPNATVVFDVSPSGTDMSLTFLIEPGGCLARVYA